MNVSWKQEGAGSGLGESWGLQLFGLTMLGHGTNYGDHHWYTCSFASACAEERSVRLPMGQAQRPLTVSVARASSGNGDYWPSTDWTRKKAMPGVGVPAVCPESMLLLSWDPATCMWEWKAVALEMTMGDIGAGVQ